MTRQDLVIFLAQMVVHGSHLNTTVGIILPTFEDVKRVRKEFGMLVNTIPNFLMPEVRYNTIRNYKFGDSEYIWMHGRNAGKGRTLSQLYLSSRLTEKDLKYHLFSLIPAMSVTASGVNNIHTFIDT
jgi:hypothetical protein